MTVKVNLQKIDRLSQSASEAGFTRTHLKLEGLREGIRRLEGADEGNRQAKAQWLIRNIETSKPVIMGEIQSKGACKAFYEKKDMKFKFGVAVGFALNSIITLIACKFLKNGSESALTYGFAFVGSAMLATGAFMVWNTIRNRFATFSGFVKDVLGTLTDAENAARACVKGSSPSRNAA